MQHLTKDVYVAYFKPQSYITGKNSLQLDKCLRDNHRYEIIIRRTVTAFLSLKLHFIILRCRETSFHDYDSLQNLGNDWDTKKGLHHGNSLPNSRATEVGVEEESKDVLWSIELWEVYSTKTLSSKATRAVSNASLEI